MPRLLVPPLPHHHHHHGPGHGHGHGQHVSQGALLLNVRRSALVQDTLAQLQRIPSSADLKRPLKIQFHGEDGIDAGGVKREFFALLIRDLFSVDYNMWTVENDTLVINPTSIYSPSSASASASASSSSAAAATGSSPVSALPTSVVDLCDEARNTLAEYELVGTLMGLALSNNVHLELSLPRVYYRKLLHGAQSDPEAGLLPPVPLAYSLSDLADVSPEVAKGLHLLQIHPAASSAEFADTFGLDFTFEHTVFGERIVRELVEGGASIPVTLENRAAYVAAYTKYVLHDSIQLQFEALAKGFFKVAAKAPFRLLQSPEDLEVSRRPTHARASRV